MQNVKKWIAAMLSLALILALALSSTAFAAVDDTGYSDVDAGNSYAEAILYCREHGLMEGVGGNRFDLDGPLTRAALATVLYRMEGEPTVTETDTFTDTANGRWYSDAILWASQRGLMEGYGGGIFGINDPVTRQDMVTTLWRYVDSPKRESASRYEDESDIAGYAAAAVNWAGTTRGVAQNIVTALGTDTATLHEITAAQPYTAADLDYTNSNCRSVTEQHDPSARPAIANSVNNMEQYDVVFLGYPIWNNDAPRIIYTFLESENLSGKTIVPFCTSGGSGIANSVSNIRGLINGATWMDGRRCYSSDTVDTLTGWIDSLGLGLDSSPTPAPTPEPPPTHTPTPAPNDVAKVLVAYFSATNTTKPLAEYIADGLDTDIYEIVPATPYTSADLNYGNSSSRATVEQNDPSARPAISNSVSGMEQYDVVFLG